MIFLFGHFSSLTQLKLTWLPSAHYPENLKTNPVRKFKIRIFFEESKRNESYETIRSRSLFVRWKILVFFPSS